ncbi:competence/damage-inducible protein A [Thermoflexus hugenholtzii]|jgi:Predicted nucleotide-utilizing enzyme related to molybdopterin-biosynthesis enzyme MoeA|uniref:Molybdenum cofactor synthesis domain-containing protein n=1 Tax=Thermoflexus hugenholtzii JAD2 TaxID=877466 RepID=A0A212Q171_9CHLR|nr:molybdopterin-binding protein [Thermoflexus hugenholtzii]SNB53107.1 molybdenum cofactor synthesis domain-containing protein [Thermoflexus hugenholtzii JAD2]
MPAHPPTAEILAIGNELLLGEVVDTNTAWLCRFFTGLGGKVQRAVVLPDEVEAIAAELQGALRRAPALVFTTGGLGPTEDDRTLAAVAMATGRPLEEHPEALRMVAARYRELAAAGFVAEPDLTPPRRKMAMLPRGAIPLANPVGAAPGVLLPLERTLLVCLPGVPEEMKAIVQSSLAPHLQARLGRAGFAELRLLTDCGDESRLAPLLGEVGRAFPHVYIKSRARAFGPQVRIQIYLSAAAPTPEEAQALVEEAGRHLEGRLAEAGVSAERLPAM